MKKPLTNVDNTIDWLKRLVEKIEMKIVAGPIAAYCDAENNEGITGACCVQTSHCSVHVWDKVEVPFMRLDVYSCKTFKEEDVLAMLAEFDPYDIDALTLDRNAESRVAKLTKLKKL